MMVIIVVSQFFSPEKNEDQTNALSDFLVETNPPEEVNEILKYSCFDCHSNSTNYPWYNSITPVNYWLNSNISDAKSHLNFSKWKDYSAEKKEDKLRELVEVVKEKAMPLPSYTWIHHEADLSHDQIQEIVNWAKLESFKYSLATKAQ